MSVLDWVDLGLHRKGEEIPGFKGSFSVTLGDAVAGVFGARHAHIFGPDVRLVCDIENMIMSKIPLHSLAGLAEGIGGGAAFIYGQNTTATYVGPAVTLRRGPSWTKAAASFFPKALDPADPFNGFPLMGGNPPVGVTAEEQYAMDNNLAKLVLATSAILCLVTAGLELAIRFKYPTFNSSTNEDPSSTAQLLYDLTYTLCSRLMELIVLMEQAGTVTLFLKGFMDDGEKLLKTIGTYTGIIPAYKAITTWWTGLEDDTKIAIVVVAVLVAIIALLIGVAVAMAVAGAGS